LSNIFPWVRESIRFIEVSYSNENNRGIHEVRKIQHQNPEFGRKGAQFFKRNLPNSTFSIQQGRETHKTINFDGFLSFTLLSFFLSWVPPLLLHIFSLFLPVQPTCTATYSSFCTLCIIECWVLAFHTEI
jgi:hypothetical protein